MTLARNLLLAAIRGYKRHVSPRKRFACAYRVHLGACSCSTLGLRAISRYGAWRGVGVLRLRLQQCHRVAEDLRARPFVVRSAQAGSVDCDLPCDACDTSACSGCDTCEIAGCASNVWNNDACDCNWGSTASGGVESVARRRRRLRDEAAARPDEPPPEP